MKVTVNAYIRFNPRVGGYAAWYKVQGWSTWWKRVSSKDYWGDKYWWFIERDAALRNLTQMVQEQIRHERIKLAPVVDEQVTMEIDV